MTKLQECQAEVAELKQRLSQVVEAYSQQVLDLTVKVRELQRGPKLKPLQWKPSKHWDDTVELWCVEVSFVSYRISATNDEVYWRFTFNNSIPHADVPCESIEAGKAACQLHWEQLVKSCLEL